MKTMSLSHSDTLGQLAHLAVRQHFQQTVRWKKAVLQDRDPENLHQMRVGIRRLRTTLALFEGSLRLPKAISASRLRSIARILGAVRDWDVLGQMLRRFRPLVDPTEARLLAKLVQRLGQQRQSAFAKLVEMLGSPLYQEFQQALQTWLEDPQQQPTAAYALPEALPDLLLSPTSLLLLHPGWFVEDLPTDPIDWGSWADRSLHDLRKQIKRLRYLIEIVIVYVDPGDQNRALVEQKEECAALQEVLGTLQDSVVFSQFLARQLGRDWASPLPELRGHLSQIRTQTWQEWQPWRQRYRDPVFRHSLRQQMLLPFQSL